MAKKFALDTETFYSKSCSVRNGGMQAYLNHPDFDCYLMAIHEIPEEGMPRVFVGDPAKFDYRHLEGATIVAHNASFDEQVVNKLIDDGIIPKFTPKEWVCTADMAAYLGVPRDLAGAAGELCGLSASKEVRDNMKGKMPSDLGEDELKALYKYAEGDVVMCGAIWDDHRHKWPDWEREISAETRRMGYAGLPVDPEEISKGVATLEEVIDRAKWSIPWHETEAKDLSPIAWAKWCRDNGLTPPKTQRKDDPETQQWMKDNPAGGQVLENIHTLRGANALYKKMVMMRGCVSGDRLPFAMMYFGANMTGRDSGAGGFNTQNISRDEIYGVSLRKAIAAPPGHKLVVADLSQIEARVAAWLAGQKDVLEVAASGIDYYEAMARAWGLWQVQESLKENPKLRHKIKMTSLGCQYGLGYKRLAAMTGMSEREASEIVELFRYNSPEIVRFWGTLEKSCRSVVGEEDNNWELVLPSGRVMNYRDVRGSSGGVTVKFARGGRFMERKVWGGALLENMTQAVARDIFMTHVLQLVDAGLPPVLRVHDEVVLCVPEKDAKDAAKTCEEIMSTRPAWCEDLPLAADSTIVTRYNQAK